MQNVPVGHIVFLALLRKRAIFKNTANLILMLYIGDIYLPISKKLTIQVAY